MSATRTNRDSQTQAPRFPIPSDLLQLGDPEGDPQEPGWANLGDWSRAEHYRAACRALADRLADAAQLQPDCSLLDLGCGPGTQLTHWVQQHGVARVQAVEIDAPHVQSARQRVQAAGLQSAIQVHQGDARQLTQILPEGAHFDRLVALDCAYHFRSRADCLTAGLTRLRPGGRAAWTDLALADSGRSARPWLPLVCHAMDIPRRNLQTLEAYRREVEALGFRDVEIELLDDPVLGGFARFARAQRIAHMPRLPSQAWLKVMLTGWACALATRHRALHYLLVRARA